ncbi:MAG: 5'/3'-nucleotidase SurE, partial [Eubacteriales bacterium]
ASHSITIREPLFYGETVIEGVESKVYWVKGTPADCVKLAFEKILEHKVDFVISGINDGYNLGTDVLYSGTVSAAIEGSLYEVPSIAISTDFRANKYDYLKTAKYVNKILNNVIDKNMGKNIVINVNVPLLPEDQIKGIKICRIGERRYTNVYAEKITEEGERSYVLAGDLIDEEADDTDVYQLGKGYVTITPLHYDLTNFGLLQQVSRWFE